MAFYYWRLCPGVIITPLVIRASRGNARCHHSPLPAVTNNVASLRLTSEAHPCVSLPPDVLAPASSSLLSRSRHHHHHHHHPHFSSSASVDNSCPADVQLTSQILIRPTYDNQLPLKHVHSSTEILSTASWKMTSIDAPLEQLSLPPPLIPVPCSQVPSKHATSATRDKTQSHAPRKSLPSSTPPPVPVRRSLGNVRETMTPAAPIVLPPPVDLSVAEPTRTGDAPSSECVVCLERAPDSVLYTCGHMCMCYTCARDVLHNGDTLCPICRQSIRDVIKIFRSWTNDNS